MFLGSSDYPQEEIVVVSTSIDPLSVSRLSYSVHILAIITNHTPQLLVIIQQTVLNVVDVAATIILAL
jgi:hypothetical protein